MLDFSVLVLPGILLFTVLADHAHIICLLSLALIGALTTYSIWSAPKQPRVHLGSIPYLFPSLPFITALRTYTNLFTAIAILAVDFTIFPRRYAKAETYGTGLMDIGVGLFVVAHGITSPEARGHSDNRCVCVCVCDHFVLVCVIISLSLSLTLSRGYVWRVGGTVKRVVPLLLLGVVRLASVKASGYQEHVTEYGVHWNFFFTIATVRVSGSGVFRAVIR